MIESIFKQDIQDIITDCQKESRKKLLRDSPSSCFEIFRRAIDEANNSAWEAIQRQYRKLAISWIHKTSTYKLEHAVIEDLAQETFIRFWRTITKKKTPIQQRFKHISTILGYLKRCAVTTFLDWQRRNVREGRIQEMLEAQAKHHIQFNAEHFNTPTGESQEKLETIKSWVEAHIKDEKEQLVLQMSFEYGQKPTVIAANYPEIFAGAKEVRKIKERILKRARRSLT